MKYTKPKIKDSVERYDMSELSGTVVEVLNHKYVLVEWRKGKTYIEKIADLALVRR